MIEAIGLEFKVSSEMEVFLLVVTVTDFWNLNRDGPCLQQWRRRRRRRPSYYRGGHVYQTTKGGLHNGRPEPRQYSPRTWGVSFRGEGRLYRPEQVSIR